MYYNYKKKCTELPTGLPWLLKPFLVTRLYDALENGREEETNNIQTIMREDNQGKNWRTTKTEMGKSRTPVSTMMETFDEERKVT